MQFKFLQSETKKSIKKLLSDVESRWNYCKRLFESILLNEDAIKGMFHFKFLF